MQILIACNSLSNQRGGGFVAALAHEFRENGHSVCITTVYAGESALSFQLEGFEVNEEFAALPGRNFDLVQAHDSPSAILARHYFPTIPIIFVVDAYQYVSASPPSIYIEISSYVFLSEAEKNRWIGEFGINPQKTVVLSEINGESLKKCAKEITEQSTRQITFEDTPSAPAREILFYRSILKEHAKLAEAMAELQAEHSRIRQELDNLKPKLTALHEGYNREKETLRNQRKIKGLSTPPAMTADSQARSTELPDRESYRGENLLFILGPPRSGTTWMLSLLKEHPDVVAATVDNLGARINEAQTLETGIFLEDRGLSEEQIRDRFFHLSSSNPGKVIVEKTPIHTLYVDRIRSIFPLAALVLVQRDGRDVVTSMLKVAKDKSSWWKGAPGEIADASALWLQYAEAARANERDHKPIKVRYEDLSSDPVGELKRILGSLGMSSAFVGNQVDASRAGRNIPIKGVYRKGKTGGWHDQFGEWDLVVFKSIAGPMLILLGYEKDDSWGL